MKCEQCGFIPNPGDQVCINCGAKLSIKNAVMPGVETINIEKNKNNNKKIIPLLVSIIIVLSIIIFVIVKFLVLKR